MPIDRKYERDIDLLLAEEFSVNPAFATWVLSKTKFASQEAEVVDVHVSRADVLGESDLIVIFARPTGDRFALLIEDKLDAPLQPDQAERYRQRAEKEVRLGLCAEFEIVLAAPRHYIEYYPGLEGFDVKIAHEDIGAKIAELDPSPRGLYRADFIGSASTKRINAWKRQSDDATDSFWEAAYRIATEEFPILEMKRVAISKGNVWLDLRPHDMPTMPRRTYVRVKGDRGFIDLTISNTVAAALHPDIAPLLGTGMSIHQTGKSAAIRIETEGFSVTDELGMTRIRSAFSAAAQLIEFYRANRTELDDAARSATPI